MKKLYIYLLVILCVVCSLFVSVSAETFTDFNLSINYQIFDTSRDIVTATNTLDRVNSSTFLIEAVSDDTVVNYAMYAQASIDFKKIDGSLIASAGDSLNVSIINISSFLELDDDSYIWDDFSITARFFDVYYLDGTIERFSTNINWYYNSSQYNHSISSVINVSKDVVSIKYTEYININAWTGFFGYANQVLIGGDLSNPLTVSINIKSKELGALEDIDDKIDSAINGTVDSESPPNSSDFGELKDIEDDLMNNVQNYLDEGIGFFDNAVGSIIGVANGFQAIKVLSAPVFNLPFANDVILVSVSLGLIGTLLGIVSMASSSISRKQKAESNKSKVKKGG